MKRWSVRGVLFISLAAALLGAVPRGQAQSGANSGSGAAAHRAIIYVMPNAVTNPGPGDNSRW
jgi:hypothetical protein